MSCEVAGKLHRADLGANQLAAGFGWLLETYQIRTEGFKNLVGGDDTGFRVGDYLAKLRVNTDRDARIYQELEVKLGLTDHVSRETYLGLTDPDFGDDPVLRYPASQPDVMDADHRLLQGRWFIRPSQAFDATVTAYRSDFKRNWYKLQSVLGTGISSVMDRPAEHEDALAILRGADSDTDALRVRANNRRYFAQGVQATGGWSPGAHRIEASLRLHQDEEDRFQLEDGYQCVCNDGYDGDGQVCSNIDECAGDNPCAANQTCVDLPGTFRCDCAAGFQDEDEDGVKDGDN